MIQGQSGGMKARHLIIDDPMMLEQIHSEIGRLLDWARQMKGDEGPEEIEGGAV
jgi:hypothetical protein